MNKHLICYPILVLTIAILAGQVSSPKSNDVNIVEPKTIIVEPDDYKSTKRELKKLKTKLEKKENLISSLNTRLSDKDSEIEKIKLAKIVEKPGIQETKFPLKSILNSANRMADNPQVKEMMKKQILMRYSSLFKRLNLNDAKKEEFIKLIMERDKQKHEKLMAMFLGEETNQTDLNQKTDADKEIEALLGSDYESFDFYEKTTSERMQLDNINISLSDEDKLSIEQEDQLVGLLKKRNEDIIDGNKKSDEEYVAESSQFLNDTQKEEFNKSLKTNKNRFDALPFINVNVQVIESLEIK